MTDAQLLEQFVSLGSQAAFGEIVSRHIGWIGASALRRLRDPGLSEDATQAVFILLARKAPSLRKETVLSAWLFASLRFTCLAISRTERRRTIRENEAAAMREADSSTDPVWDEVSGQLDEVVAKLSGSDRRAVLLRFYESKTYGEVGSVLGISEEAARKRVQRAVGKLTSIFRRRGVNFSAGAIGAAMIVHVVPTGAGIASGTAAATTSVASAALSATSGTSAASGAAVAKTAGGLIALGQMKIAAVALICVAAATTGGIAVVKSRAPAPAKAQAMAFAAPVAAVATAPSSAPAEKAATFAGGQIFSPEDKPVPGARVTLVGYDKIKGFYSALDGVSDTNGRFRLAIPAGVNASSVLVDAAPYAYAQAAVSEGEEAEVYLTSGRTAVVTLRMADGSAAAGVKIAPERCNGGDTLLPQDYWGLEFSREMQAKLMQTTDAEGKCRFERMPGNSNVIFDLRDERFAKLDYMQGVPMGEDVVAEGEPVTLVPAGSISGRLIGIDGKGLANVAVQAQREDGAYVVAGTTDAGGVYRIGQLGPATYFIMIAAINDLDASADSTPWTAAARTYVAVAKGASVQGIDMQATRGVIVSGKVTFRDTGAPAGDIAVDLSGPSTPSNGGRMLSTHTRADGTYSFRVPWGKQKVALFGDVPEGYTAAPARSVSANGDVSNVDFALPRMRETAKKMISGVVRRADGMPAEGATVAAQDQERPYNYNSVKADAQGRFRIMAIASKAYLRATQGKLRTTKLMEVKGGETNVALVVEKITPIVLKGRVVDAEGKGIAGAKVNLDVRYGSVGFVGATSVTADAQGNYALAQVQPGESYQIGAQAKRFGHADADVKLSAGQTAVEQPALVLQKANSVVTGTVINVAGEPMGDVEVSIDGNMSRWQQMSTDAAGAFEFADVVEGDVLHVNLHRGNDYANGGDLKAGTVGASVVFKKQ